MPEVTSRLMGPANVASGTSTLFTGTTAHVYAIRAIRFANNGTAAITVKVGIGGVTDALLIIPAISIPPGSYYEDTGLVVIAGTETIQANASASGLTATIIGLDQS